VAEEHASQKADEGRVEREKAAAERVSESYPCSAMRRKKTLSQRAQMSVNEPRSCVTDGSSHRAASGWRFGSKTRKAKNAAAQIAARLQR
jgi:hypothetical protein